MADLTPIKLDIPPGVLKNQSALASSGRYTDTLNVRFWQGRAQKIGGSTALLTIANAMTGEVSAMHTWNDLTARSWLAAASEQRLCVYPNTDFSKTDVTPEVVIQNVLNVLTTTNGSATVRVNFTASGAVLTQIVNIASATAVGGITPNGSFEITNIVDSDHFEFTFTSAATSTATGGGTPRVSLDLAPGDADPSSGFGWGAGSWGLGTWGTPRDSGAISFKPRQWSLDNYGKLLLAAASDGTLYSLDPTTNPIVRATAVSNAPTIMQGFFVTSENTVMAYGTNLTGSQDAMQIWWSGQNTIDDWDVTALASTAQGSPSGSRRLRIGTRIVGGCDLANNTNLIWTDAALYLNQYTGSKYVYTTKLVGQKCGLLGAKAFCTASGVAYWASVNSLKMYDGSVKDIPNSVDVSQWIYDQVRPYFAVKTVCFYNETFNEVWFGFILDGNTTPTLWAFVSTQTWIWSITTLGRQAATAFPGSETHPLLADTNGMIYSHEDGLDDCTIVADAITAVALPWSLSSAPLELQDGSISYDVWHAVPDMQRQVGDVSLTLTAYDRTAPSATVLDTQAETFDATTGLVDFTVAGREVALAWAGTGLGCDMRMGIPKILVTPAGERP